MAFTADDECYCNIARNIVSLFVRLVLDTAVMVAAIRSDAGASRKLLDLMLKGDPGLRMLITVPLLIEYEAVMTRAQHLKVSRLSVEDVGILLDAVASAGEPVRLAFLWRPTLPDADDDMVLEAAANGRADGLVTFNRRDFAFGASQFAFPVWSPGEALTQSEKRR